MKVQASVIVRELLAAGLEGNALVTALERIEAHAEPDDPTPLERRRTVDRERQRSHRAKKSEQTGDLSRTSRDNRDSHDPLSPRPSIPEPTPIPPLTGGTFPSLSPQPSCQALVAEIWSITPKRARQRSGKQSLERAVAAALRRKADPARLLAGVKGCYASEDFSGDFAPGVHTVITTGRWEAFAELPAPSDVASWPEARWRLALEIWREREGWADEWGPRPGEPGCIVPAHLLIGAVA